MENIDLKNVGRNDPCPCGSGKKVKKCHGESTPWQGNTPAAAASTEGGTAGADAAPQFDPSKMDLNWLANFSSAIQRLPKGQLTRLQALMQKAMSGKDVGRELEEFQRTLPVNIQELLKNSPELNAQLDQASQASAAPSELPKELTADQKIKLQEIQKNNEKAGLSRLWNRFRKK